MSLVSIMYLEILFNKEYITKHNAIIIRENLNDIPIMYKINIALDR